MSLLVAQTAGYLLISKRMPQRRVHTNLLFLTNITPLLKHGLRAAIGPRILVPSTISLPRRVPFAAPSQRRTGRGHPFFTSRRVCLVLVASLQRTSARCKMNSLSRVNARLKRSQRRNKGKIACYIAPKTAIATATMWQGAASSTLHGGCNLSEIYSKPRLHTSTLTSICRKIPFPTLPGSSTQIKKLVLFKGDTVRLKSGDQFAHNVYAFNKVSD